MQKRNITITTTAAQASLATPIRLESLLSDDRKPMKLGKLSKQQRLQIAVTLASTVLQLYESPWLSENWSKSDICFFFNGADSNKRPMISDPYVSRSFGVSGRPQPMKQGVEQNAEALRSDMIKNKTLFALGIVLIELCLNVSFEDLCSSPDNQYEEPRPQEITQVYQTALSQIDAVYTKWGDEYGYVVQRCLKCDFGTRESMLQLDFDAFRGCVYEGVLAPLEERLQLYSLLTGAVN